jgi:pimeloyl-ACP methyl ester carboxylesterase
MAGDFTSFLDALGLQKIDVVGFSLGGMIAQQLALDHPKWISIQPCLMRPMHSFAGGDDDVEL